jgi:hypothetical protein
VFTRPAFRGAQISFRPLNLERFSMCCRVAYSLCFAVLTFLLLSISPYGVAQSAQMHEHSRSGVPRVVKFSGVLRDATGLLLNGTQSVSFAVYADATGGTSLWEEIQNVQFANGRYTVLLGVTTTEGMPPELFAADESRWLGVRSLAVGEQEQSRVFLTSVPYAIRAADADSLGGLPSSAYARVDPVLSTNASVAANGSPTAPSASGDGASSSTWNLVRSGRPLTVTTSGGTANYVPLFSAASSISNSDIRDIAGVVTVPALETARFNGIIFVDGERYTTLARALAACPASGCTIDMRGNSSSSALALGTFDPGTAAVTLLLGPYRYTARQITLRTNLQIIGYGSGTVSGGHGTQIISSSSTNEPLFVIPQAHTTPAQFVLLRNFEILGAAGNTSQDGFFLDASEFFDSGLRYSVFDQLKITGFKGVPLHLRGAGNNYSDLNEWDQFRELTVYRTSGGGNDITIEGANGQIEFIGGQYDGVFQGDGTNIYVGTYAGGSAVPLDISFHKVTSQLANVGVNINGCRMCDFQMHHEAINGVYLLSHTGTDVVGDQIVIENTQFDNGSGINGGNGYLVKVATTLANVVFQHNAIAGIPDQVIQGTNGMSFSASDNMFDGLPTNVYASFGVAYQTAPAATLGIGRAHLVRLNASATCISTLQSALGPGELLTFRALGDVCFSSGGNIELGSYSLSLKLALGQTATFIRNDADVNFTLIGTSAAPVVGTSLPVSATAPKISAGFGASASIAAHGTAAFTVNVGPSPSSSGVISLPTAATGWNCFAFDVTSPTTGGGYYVKQTSGSTTSATLTGYNTSGSPTAWTANDILRVSCLAF